MTPEQKEVITLAVSDAGVGAPVECGADADERGED